MRLSHISLWIYPQAGVGQNTMQNSGMTIRKIFKPPEQTAASVGFHFSGQKPSGILLYF